MNVVIDPFKNDHQYIPLTINHTLTAPCYHEGKLYHGYQKIQKNAGPHQAATDEDEIGIAFSDAETLNLFEYIPLNMQFPIQSTGDTPLKRNFSFARTIRNLIVYSLINPYPDTTQPVKNNHIYFFDTMKSDWFKVRFHDDGSTVERVEQVDPQGVSKSNGHPGEAVSFFQDPRQYWFVKIDHTAFRLKKLKSYISIQDSPSVMSPVKFTVTSSDTGTIKLTHQDPEDTVFSGYTYEIKNINKYLRENDLRFNHNKISFSQESASLLSLPDRNLLFLNLIGNAWIEEHETNEIMSYLFYFNLP
ncbi:MAG: hypothetical protein JW969_10585 [Spirochaetales bacterium]|nr:hypothetical protein [Spirochaetales bacterium]